MSYSDCNHARAPQPLVAPFRVIADFREAVDGWQFTNLPHREQPSRCWTVPVEYRYLETADYTVEGLPIFIVRRDAKDFLSLLQHLPERVAKEHAKLRELEAGGASCLVVIEGDAEAIAQILGRRGCATYWRLRSCQSIDEGLACLFADDRRTAELMAFEVMLRAWQRSYG
jgi:hypothetical protein